MIPIAVKHKFDVHKDIHSAPYGHYGWLCQMRLGDSRFVAGVKITAISSTIAYYQRKTGMRFSRRSVTERGRPGVRIWRVA